ncbi:MAG: hypothetical protein EPO65_13800 [Dehalococcoidia bacterium]|nr:MAG: hypothetical protein EPO65_13800 [Dehalococcoidia bacterium]
MGSRETRVLRLAGIGAAVLLAVAAGFQSALALGLPLGAATLGGRATTVDGVLTPPFRGAAAATALVLVLFAWLFLVRAQVLPRRVIGPRAARLCTGAVLFLMVVNTAGNFSAPHPLERWGMGAVTSLVVLLGGFVALRAPADQPGASATDVR